MKNIIIYGTGSLANEIISFERALERPRFIISGYFNDNGRDAAFEEKYCVPLLEFDDIKCDHEILVCIADPESRMTAVRNLEKIGCSLYSYIHPTAVISKNSVLSNGCIIYPFVVVSANARLGSGVIINSYSGIGHDVNVGEFTTISAHVDLTGYVSVGCCCFFGSGSRVAPGKKIGSYSKIGAGIAVIRSLKDNSKIFPYPNKIIYD